MSIITAEGPGIDCYIADETGPLNALSGPVVMGDMLYITCDVTTTADGSRQGFHMKNVIIGTNAEMDGFTIPISDDNG